MKLIICFFISVIIDCYGGALMSITEPFLRWAGGKNWLVNQYLDLIKNIDINHYHEPFLGGASIFFSSTHSSRSYLSDVNGELINTYICVRDNPHAVITILKDLNNTEEEYYRVRSMQTAEPIMQAARFIFLNQTSYNGIYRVNKNGIYNIPYGKRSWAIDENRLLLASGRLKNANIKQGDFDCNKYIIKPRDLVFLDPPYTVSHNNNGFIKYNQTLFSLDDQYRLSKYIDYIKRKNAYYILTNAAHQTIADIFEKGDRRLELSRKSLIGGKNATRQDVKEFVFTNIPCDY